MEFDTSSAADGDDSLVRRVMHGDRDAFGHLVNKYKHAIVNFASRVLGDPVEAQDVAQKVFVQAFQQCARFRFESSFSTWLYAIARNSCKNELRRRSRHKRDFDESCDGRNEEPPKAPAGDTGPKEVIRRELEEKINQALEDLPARQRAALGLLLEQDLSYEEISALQGTSLSMTKTLIHRGRQELKRKLRPYLLNGVWPEGCQSASQTQPV